MEEQKNQSQSLLSIPSSWSLIIQSFRLYWSVIGSVLLVGMVPAIVTIADYTFSFLGFSGLSALMSLLSAFVALIFYPALIIVFVSKGDPSGVKSFSEVYKEAWSVLGSYMVLISLFAVMIAGGLLLLIVPAIYVGVMTSLSFFVWIVEGKKGKDALTRSWFYVKGSWKKIFWRYFFMGAILLIIQGLVSGIFSLFFPSQPIPIPTSSIPYNIPPSLLTMAAPQTSLAVSLLGYFFSVPVMIAMGLVVYRLLQSQKSGQLDDGALAASRKSVSRFIILGIVALILLIVVILGAFSFALFQLKGLM